MDNMLPGSNDEKTTSTIPSPTARAQNDRVHGQHERPMFQGEDRQRKKSKTEGLDGSLMETLGTPASFTMVTPSLNSNLSNHQADLMGLNELIRLQQSLQGFHQQQDSAGQSRPAGQPQGLQLEQQQEATDQNSQALLMPSNGGYHVYASAVNNQEAGDASPIPQPRPLRPTTERTLQAAKTASASFQATNHAQASPQQEQQQILPSQLAGLQQAVSLLPNAVMPQGLQMSLNAINQGAQRSLINANTGVRPPAQFASTMLNSNFAASMGGAIFPANAATGLLPIPLREANVGPSPRTGNKPITLYMVCDDDSLSPYQCLVRKHIELFEADRDEVDGNAKGRNKPIVLGQVGIRCKHCSSMPAKGRGRGSKYYPAKLNGLYQAAQSMASGHLCNHCTRIPQALRSELLILREKKSSAGGGKKYWADGVQVLGVVEDENGLRFKKRR